MVVIQKAQLRRSAAVSSRYLTLLASVAIISLLVCLSAQSAQETNRLRGVPARAEEVNGRVLQKPSSGDAHANDLSANETEFDNKEFLQAKMPVGKLDTSSKDEAATEDDPQTEDKASKQEYTSTQPVEDPASQDSSTSAGVSDQTQVIPKETGSAGNVSLREKSATRSLEVKTLISKKLQKVVSPAPVQNPNKSTRMENLSCDQEDAFAGVPVDGAGQGWIPPGGYPIETVKKWDKEYKASMHRIKAVAMGGKELRNLAKEEVQHLRRLRHELFCV